MRATSRTDTPAASRRALVLGYDDLGRRVSQTVSNYVSGAWQQAAQRQFVYAGWHLVAVLDGQGNLKVKGVKPTQSTLFLTGPPGVDRQWGRTYTIDKKAMRA